MAGDAFFMDPARGLIEVGCWAHARRYFHKALESDQARMGPVLLLIAQLYRVEKQARPLASGERLGLRQLKSQPILEKLRNYLLEIQGVRYTLKNRTNPLLRGRRSPNRQQRHRARDPRRSSGPQQLGVFWQ
jgi:hypothetical protein